ncbi:MAG: cytochrome P450 [Actinobacteria bacterium]|nr:cytochrome P450 [Actinomycetota bacterium]
MSSTQTSQPYDPYFHTPREDLYEVYTQLRNEHPVYYSTEREVWCLSRFADVQAFARDWKNVSNEPGVDLEAVNFMGPGNFLDCDPPEHDRLRNVARPFFTPKEFARLGEAIKGRAEELCATLAEKTQVDLAEELTWRLPTWVIMRMLGAPSSDDELVHELVSVTMERDPGGLSMPPRALDSLARLRAYINDLADEKSRSPADDVMSALVSGQGSEAPSREELVGMFTLFFIAGSLTTMNFLSNTLAILEDRPDVWKIILGPDEKLRERVIEEALRIETPVQYLARCTNTDIELHGVTIPAGSRLILLYGAANRDDARWEEAEVFDPLREPKRHVAFGEGIHYCMGAPLARLEGRYMLPAFGRVVGDYEITDKVRLPSHHDLGWKQLKANIEPRSG